jgi:hypothetical protein
MRICGLLIKIKNKMNQPRMNLRKRLKLIPIIPFPKATWPPFEESREDWQKPSNI